MSEPRDPEKIAVVRPDRSSEPRPSRLQAVKGMNDILPNECAHWDQLELILKDWLRCYGYRGIRTPVLEPTPLFRRGIGEVTDIVEKEMFSFTDRLNGDELTLRPEFTAGIARSVIEHNLTYAAPQRVFSMGPVFRHERPQRGRYRQFHQLDVEALGFSGPDVDAELIVMLSRLWADLGLQNIRLELNCLGSAQERKAHRQSLIDYFSENEALLDEDARRRLHTNPLRILDTKNPAMQALVDAAPRLETHLGEESKAHFEGVQRLLKDCGVVFTVNPRLVRGLDYYNLTVFEWITDQLGSQGTICGGGRYDGLVEVLGGKPTPAVGFAIGLERLLELWSETRLDDLPAEVDCYMVYQSENARRRCFSLAEQLRDAGLNVLLHGGGGSMKSQMKRADQSGAPVAVILGDDELQAGTATVKVLRGESSQMQFQQDGLSDALYDLLFSDDEGTE